jgi:hypothetical protein
MIILKDKINQNKEIEMKNLNFINEDINRMRLLMGYDSKKTYTENVMESPQIIVKENNLINEITIPSGGIASFGDDVFRNFTGGFGGSADDFVSKGLRGVRGGLNAAERNAFNSLKTQIDDAFRIGGLSGSVDEVMKKFLGKSLAPDEAKKLFIGFAKSNQITPELSRSFAATLSNSNRFVSSLVGSPRAIKSVATMEDDLINHFVKNKKYSPIVAQDLAREVTSKIKNNKTLLDKLKQRLAGGGKGKGGSTTWKYLKKLATWQNLKRAAKVAGIIVAGYWTLKGIKALWNWWTANSPLPPCLTLRATEDEVKRASDSYDLEYIDIKNTGIKEIDDMGGAKFTLTSNEVKIGNGQVGTWDTYGDVIAITAGGTTYQGRCSGASTGGSPVPVPPPVPSPSKYRDCTSFPYEKGCKSVIIGEIQRCLGITDDNKYGPQTERALRDGGYSTTIDKVTYDQIMSKCTKGVEPGPEPRKEKEIKIDQGDYLRGGDI